MFKKKHVGRPSNKELKQRRNRKILITGFSILVILLIVFFLLNNVRLNSLMGNSTSIYYCEDSTYTLQGNNCIKVIKETPVLLGDIDLDGTIDVDDLNLLNEYLIMIDSSSSVADMNLTDFQMAAADLDKNGEIYIPDFQILSLYFEDNSIVGTYGSYYENIGNEKVCAQNYTLNGNYCEKTNTVSALVKSQETGENTVDINIDQNSMTENSDTDTNISDDLKTTTPIEITYEDDQNGIINLTSDKKITITSNFKINDTTKKYYYIWRTYRYNVLSFESECLEIKNGTLKPTLDMSLGDRYGNFTIYSDASCQMLVSTKDTIKYTCTNCTKQVTTTITPKTSATSYTKGAVVDLNVDFSIYDTSKQYYYIWNTYADGKAIYTSACQKVTTGTKLKTLTINATRYGEIIIYSDSSCKNKINTTKTKTYTVNQFTIKYSSGTGSGSMNNQTVNYGINTTLSKNKFTKKGYIFDGWISYNNTTGKWYCYTNAKKTSKGKVDQATCEKYGYVKYKDQAIVSQSANPGETVTFTATWIDPTKAVTIKFTPETSSTTVYSRYKYKIGISLTLNSDINNYYYKWITYKDGKVNYNGTCTKVTTKSMTYTLDMMGKRYGQIVIYSDSKCSTKVSSKNTSTYNLSSVIWPVTPQFQLLQHDKMVTRVKHYAYGISEGHEGLDITVPIGTPVYAIADGTICSTYSGTGVNSDEDYGNALIQTTTINGKTYRIIYAHLKSFVVKSGKVSKGQIIAYSGMTGGTRIPHVHIDIRNTSTCSINSGTKIDPLTILPSISNFNNLKSSVSRSDYTTSEFPDSSIDLYNRMMAAQNKGTPWNYTIYGRVKKDYKISSSLTLKKGTIVELVSRTRYKRYQLKIKYNNKTYSNLDETYFEFVWNN